MQQSSYLRYGDAPGLYQNQPPPPADRVVYEGYGVGIIVAAAFLTAAGKFLVSRIVVSNSLTQTACLVMDAQRQ